jgi:hypothetical protein
MTPHRLLTFVAAATILFACSAQESPRSDGDERAIGTVKQALCGPPCASNEECVAMLGEPEALCVPAGPSTCCAGPRYEARLYNCYGAISASDNAPSILLSGLSCMHSATRIELWKTFPGPPTRLAVKDNANHGRKCSDEGMHYMTGYYGEDEYSAIQGSLAYAQQYYDAVAGCECNSPFAGDAEACQANPDAGIHVCNDDTDNQNAAFVNGVCNPDASRCHHQSATEAPCRPAGGWGT